MSGEITPVQPVTETTGKGRTQPWKDVWLLYNPGLPALQDECMASYYRKAACSMRVVMQMMQHLHLPERATAGNLGDSGSIINRCSPKSWPEKALAAWRGAFTLSGQQCLGRFPQ